jgi:hypothetical protein
VDDAGLKESALHKQLTYMPRIDLVSTAQDFTRSVKRFVIEVRQNDQYVMRVDGFGSVTLHIHIFFRRFMLYEPSIPAGDHTSASSELTHCCSVISQNLSYSSSINVDADNPQ